MSTVSNSGPRDSLVKLQYTYVDRSQKMVCYSGHVNFVIIDREAGEIIRFVVSISPSVHPSVEALILTGCGFAVDHPFNSFYVSDL